MSVVGAGRRALSFPDGLGLFGFGPGGGRGMSAPAGNAEHDTLEVRALWLSSSTGKLLLISCDLVAGSRVVHAVLLEVLRRDGVVALEPGELLVVGTHTHSGPGHMQGNLYDWFGQWPPGFRASACAEVVRKAVLAARDAISGAQPARAGFARSAPLWGAGRNRSLRAFSEDFRGDLTRWTSRFTPPPPRSSLPEEGAVDPRLSVFAFVGEPGGALLATLATWSCHPTSFPPATRRAWHRDWPGVAVDTIEAAHARTTAFALQGASGDVTAIPAGEVEVARPVARAKELGRTVAAAWEATLVTAIGAAAPLDLEVGFKRMVPELIGLDDWELGTPVILGSEEARPGPTVRLFGEARTFRWRPNAAQRPKLPALGPLQAILQWLLPLEPSPEHPLWLIKLAGALIFASPFEQTTIAAWRLEEALVEAWTAKRGAAPAAALPLGLAGDYAGYLTTPEEYAVQHYEGAHTLYGVRQHEVLTSLWREMTTATPLALDPSPPVDDEELSERAAKVLALLLP